tara:strand:- start:263 stop:484 length:222 start_codon:yes stop_codon:yes gene_type:complete
MHYKFILIVLLFFLNNCSPAGNAFFGPSITAVKTGSITQTSASYTSSRLLNSVKDQILVKNNLNLLNKVPHKS